MTEPAPAIGRAYTWYEIFYGMRPNKPKYLPEQYPDLTGKTALVTGCNTGIGFECIRLLYMKNCNIVAVVRTESKGEEAKQKILKEFTDSKGSISVVGGCDFLDLTAIKPVSIKIKEALGTQPLNIIIHNAGLMASDNTLVSKQGYESMFCTNVLGPQLLQHFLDPLFLKEDSDLKRIVWVSSGAHLLGLKEYGINWENPTYEGIPVKERPSAQTLYAQSKAANIFQANAWATKNKDIVDKIGCVSVSCYPGILNSDLQRDWSTWARKLTRYIFWDTIYGAYSELYAALSSELTTKDQGAYIVPFGEVHDPRNDVKAGLSNGSDQKLWDWTEEKISQFF